MSGLRAEIYHWEKDSDQQRHCTGMLIVDSGLVFDGHLGGYLERKLKSLDLTINWYT